MNRPPRGVYSLDYYFMCDPSVHPGPFRTSLRLAEGLAKALGPEAVRPQHEGSERLGGLLRLVRAAARSRSDVVILRHVPPAGLLVLLLGCVLRLRRRFFVLQVPTPVSCAADDRNVRRGTLYRLLAQASTNVAHPLVFLLPHLIIQYAPETGRMARIGRSKTVLMTHPAERPVLSHSIRPNYPIHFVGLTSSGNSPGFDRLIRGIAVMPDSSEKQQIRITLVGDPEVLCDAKLLVAELGLASQVSFPGPLFDERLDALLDEATIGVGTLAPHRVGLIVASPLKHRTYLSKGVPFMTAVDDPGLPDDASWLFRLDADDSPIDVQTVRQWALALDRDLAGDEMFLWASQELSAVAVAERLLGEITERLRPRSSIRADQE